MTAGAVRRIVTGHDAAGNAVIQSDDSPPRVYTLSLDGATFYEIWNTRETPALIERIGQEPNEPALTLAPPRHGTRIRIVDVPAMTKAMQLLDDHSARDHFAQLNAVHASTHHAANSRHPMMHKTETVDYGIVLDGEITLLVDSGEVSLRAGDIVVQRGTNHAWSNQSGKSCRIAFVLIDGKFTDGLS
jgi:mannose-6-phosphate isomerase-like protein (cupin superfamily)